jgi:putative membrane protein
LKEGEYPIAAKPDAQEMLANERTFLSWLRTGISLMAFGFVVSKFDLFLQITAHRPVQNGAIGLALVAGGVMLMGFATWQFRRNYIRIVNGEPLEDIRYSMLTGFILVAIGLAVFVYMLHT